MCACVCKKADNFRFYWGVSPNSICVDFLSFFYIQSLMKCICRRWEAIYWLADDGFCSLTFFSSPFSLWFPSELCFIHQWRWKRDIHRHGQVPGKGSFRCVLRFQLTVMTFVLISDCSPGHCVRCHCLLVACKHILTSSPLLHAGPSFLPPCCRRGAQ